MKQNVGNFDRVLRIIVGTALILWGITQQQWIGVIGLVPLFTGLFRWCPAYCPFGISTGGQSCDIQK